MPDPATHRPLSRLGIDVRCGTFVLNVPHKRGVNVCQIFVGLIVNTNRLYGDSRLANVVYNLVLDLIEMVKNKAGATSLLALLTNIGGPLIKS